MGREPTFVARGTSTVIDITLTLNIDVKNWAVSDKTTLSDHHMIEFEIESVNPKLEKVYNYAKTDWSKFRELSERDHYDPLIISEQWLEEECNDFIGTLDKCLKKSTPKMTIGNRVKKHNAWDSDIQELKKEVRKAFKNQKRDQLLSSWEEYTEKKREFKQKLRKARAENWKRFTERVQKRQNIQLEILSFMSATPETGSLNS